LSRGAGVPPAACTHASMYASTQQERSVKRPPHRILNHPLGIPRSSHKDTKKTITDSTDKEKAMLRSVFTQWYPGQKKFLLCVFVPWWFIFFRFPPRRNTFCVK
jgi:hypothetical protein